MMGSGRVTDEYEGAKRQRMESDQYFGVRGGGGVSDSYDFTSNLRRPRILEQSSYFGGPGTGSFYGASYASYGGSDGSSAYNFPVVRLRGLPFNCDDLEVFKFFTGLSVVDCLLVNKDGRFSGEAYVVFSSPIQVEYALQRNRQNIGRRYIEVFPSKKQEYYHAVAAEVNNGSLFDGEYRSRSPAPRAKKSAAAATHDDKDQMEYTEVLKLRGLPYSATETDIAEFFQEYEAREENVHIVRRPDGKVTGEAYVEFESVEVAKKAMSKDKMTIGSRYVELFPSTLEEAKRVESRSRQ
ncbi:hypothetical protein KSP39_PZI004728 [Platanthera zijinensis]|uniref:RRM domain-containing protein n=1 Tax=Platanthera zijinensis TaxID=2320716 RepID=A0AAP0BZF6_9ASPA